MTDIVNDEDVDFIDAILNSPLPKIRTSAFKEKYLPLLFHPSPSVFNLAWINEVAMNPYIEVLAVDDKGEVEFIIPPLRKQVNTTLDQSIATLSAQAKLEGNVHQMKANALLNDNLPRLLRFADARSLPIQERWDELLTALGYADRLATEPTEAAVKTVASDEGIGMSDDDEDW